MMAMLRSGRGIGGSKTQEFQHFSIEMLRRTRVIFAALLGAPLGTGAAEPIQPEPGLWRIETRTKTDEGPVYRHEEELCLTPPRLRDLPCRYAPRSAYDSHCSCKTSRPLDIAPHNQAAGVRCE